MPSNLQILLESKRLLPLAYGYFLKESLFPDGVGSVQQRGEERQFFLVRSQQLPSFNILVSLSEQKQLPSFHILVSLSEQKENKLWKT
jgi:hypothetical protein